jgi:hypothetical protein
MTTLHLPEQEEGSDHSPTTVANAAERLGWERVGGIVGRTVLVLLGLGVGCFVALVIGIFAGWIPFGC